MGNKINGLCCYDPDNEELLDTAPERRAPIDLKIVRKDKNLYDFKPTSIPYKS